MLFIIIVPIVLLIVSVLFEFLKFKSTMRAQNKWYREMLSEKSVK